MCSYDVANQLANNHISALTSMTNDAQHFMPLDVLFGIHEIALVRPQYAETVGIHVIVSVARH
jgi:hypothetical protein